MSTTWWLTYRFGIPLLAATHLLVARWGQNNALFIIALPILLLLLNMYFSFQHWPRHSTLEPYKPFRRARYKWHAADLTALVFLMFFEAFVAGAAWAMLQPAVPWCIMIAAWFVPYTLLSVVAQRYLREAQAMIAHTNAREEYYLAELPGERPAYAQDR